MPFLKKSTNYPLSQYRRRRRRLRAEHLESRMLLAVSALSDAPAVSVGVFAAFEFAPVDSRVGVVRVSGEVGSVQFNLTDEGNEDVDGDGDRPFRVVSGTGEILVNDSQDLDLSMLTSDIIVLNVMATDGNGFSSEEVQVVQVFPAPAQLAIDSVSGTEGDELTFTVTLDKDVEAPFTVDVTFDGGSATGGEAPLESPVDYQNTSRLLTFAGTAGESHEIVVNTLDDDLAEGTETFTARIDASDKLVVDLDTGTGTIDDNDSAAITIEDAVSVEGRSLAFTLTLDNAVEGGVDVDVSFTDGTAQGGMAPLTGSADYDNTTTTVRFSGSAGEIQQLVVDTRSDATAEDDETFTVQLSSANGAVDTSDEATGTITNNQPPVVEVTSLTTPENQPFGAVIGTITASDPDGTPVTLRLLQNANPNSGPANAISLNQATGEVTVRDPSDFDFELTDVLEITVQAMETGDAGVGLASTATVVINVTNVNEAPRIDPQGVIRSSGETATVTIGGSDPDANDNFADLSFEVVSLETDGVTPLQQAVFEARLVIQNDDLFFNLFGGEEKWLMSATTGDWYFLLPNDRIFQWDNTIGQLTGTFLGVLDPAVYDEPNLIVASRLAGPLGNPAAVPIPPGSVEASISNNVLTLVSNDFFGIADATVRVTDGGGLSDQRNFRVEFVLLNQPPELAPIGEQRSEPGEAVITVPLEATDPDGDTNLVFDARLLGPVPATLDITDGTLTITRRGRFFGTFMVEVMVRDVHGAVTTQVFLARFLPPTPGLGSGVADTDSANSALADPIELLSWGGSQSDDAYRLAELETALSIRSLLQWNLPSPAILDTIEEIFRSDEDVWEHNLLDDVLNTSR